MICLRNILIFQHLFTWQKNYLKHKIKKKNSELVEEIKNRWSNLKDEIKKLSEEEVRYKKPNDILGIINKVLDFNKVIQKQHGLRFKNIDTKPNA